MVLSRTLALISGGASGLGRAAAEHLVKRGARVLITDMNSEGKAVATALGKQCSFFPADCTSEEQVNAALDHAETHFGEPINAAINTAGIAFAAKTLNKKGVPHKLEMYQKVACLAATHARRTHGPGRRRCRCCT